MTVEELIAALRDMPPAAEVYYAEDRRDPFEEVWLDSEGRVILGAE